MYKVALGAVLLLFIHMWVKEVLREEENNEKRKEGLLSIISTDGELQKQTFFPFFFLIFIKDIPYRHGKRVIIL